MPKKSSRKIVHAQKVYQVAVNQMEPAVALITQRPFIQGHGDWLAQNLDLDLIGLPVLNHRKGKYLILDGQHRIYAMKENGFTGPDDKIDCQVYEDLTDQEAAKMFLGRAVVKAIQPFVKFMLGVTAQQERECAILRVVEANGAKISKYKGTHSIAAVNALIGVYDTSIDKDVAVGWVVRVAIHAWEGDPLGLDGAMLDALGQIYNRYGSSIDVRKLIDRLTLPQNSARTVIRRADDLRARTLRYKSQCLAAVLVDIYNKGQFGKGRLAPWWSKKETDAG